MVTKYKPLLTPHHLHQNLNDSGRRAEQVKRSAAETIAHTRELLKESREIIERTHRNVEARHVEINPSKHARTNRPESAI
jgi:hypothetical protein